MKLAFFIVCLSSLFTLAAQGKDEPLEDHLPTENLDMTMEGNSSATRPKRNKIALIYVPNANRILYGNPCALEETHKMGFEYIVEPRYDFSSKTRPGKFLNNLWVKTKLVFRQSPFWKVILNSKLKDCRNQSGDFFG